MNKNKIIGKTKNEAINIIAVSGGYVGASLLISIGINLCILEKWIGFFPIILGYELARYTFLFSLKINPILKNEKHTNN
jgi:hypothetical protein